MQQTISHIPSLAATHIGGVRVLGPTAPAPVGPVYRDRNGRPYAYGPSGPFGAVSVKRWLD